MGIRRIRNRKTKRVRVLKRRRDTRRMQKDDEKKRMEEKDRTNT